MSIIDRMPMRITGALCPACDKFVAVPDGARFATHKDRKRKPCPQGGQPIPPLPRKAGREP